MFHRKTFLALSLAITCGCGEPPYLADDGEDLDGYCRATFTADYVITDDFSGAAKLRVEEGERYLLSGLAYGLHMLVYEGEGGAVQIFLPDDLAGVPIESPCLAEDAELRPEMVAFARVEVFADEALTRPVCTIERLDRGAASFDFSLELWSDEVYQIGLSEGFCDAQTGFVRAVTVDVQGTPWTGVPILVLDQLAA